MKKIGLLLFLTSLLLARTADSGNKELLKRIIVANGYSCTSVDRAKQSSYDGTWLVFCTNDTAYNVIPSGSFWKVKKKY
ncbi:MAG: hypothetical protein DRG78_11575 [Epsilonproteobacteria bacterium]|nr:MAG: hypothetical protein DRG78_11575 [Campylobacterota bacterium]